MKYMNKIYLIIGICVLPLLIGLAILTIVDSEIVTKQQGSAAISEGGTVATIGEVVDMSDDDVMFDGSALLTIEAVTGDRYTIAVPSMGFLLCAAADSIATIDMISIGDEVQVLGTVDQEGRIVPCAAEEHYLKATGLVRDTNLGYQFSFPKGPDGYVVVRDDESISPDHLASTILYNQHEYEEFINATDAREAPAAMQVRVYSNKKQLLPAAWAASHQVESNIALALSEPEELVLGEAPSIRYLADGLYANDTYVVGRGKYIYVLMGARPDPESSIYQDFQLLVASFKLISDSEMADQKERNELVFEGKHFGYIASITNNGAVLDFDGATWLTGQAGEDAAIRAGFCTEVSRVECLPNGYFIENTVSETVGLDLSSTVEVYLMTWQMERTEQVTKQPVRFSEFVTLINDKTLHWNQLPYNITVVGNEVTRIEEVYIP